MSISKNQLVELLRLRYDAYSAEAVYQMACTRAALEGETFDLRQLATFRAALERVGDRVGRVLNEIDALLAEPAPAEPAAKHDKHAAKAEAEPAPAKPEPVTSKADPAPAKAEPAAAPTTTFVLRGVELGEREEILVCGAVPSLGDWDPAQARPMARKGGEWHATAEIPAGTEVAFKFLRRGSDGVVRWEPGGNRLVRATERLDATWRAE